MDPEQHSGARAHDEPPGHCDGRPGVLDPRLPGAGLALRLALAYAAAAVAWIILSDKALGWLGVSAATERDLSSVKGLGFVIVTALLLYVLAVRYLTHLRASEERYHRLFDNATEGLTVYRLDKEAGDTPAGLTVAAINPAETERVSSTVERARAHREMMASAVTSGSTARAELHLAADDTDELLTAYPIGRDLWALAAVDITEVRRAERALRRQDEQLRLAYVDVIGAVTGGKLILLTEESLLEQLGSPLDQPGAVAAPRELAAARHAVSRAAAARYPQWADLTDLVTPLCEALANAVKHAGGGTYQLFELDGRLQVVVHDDGPGIDFRTLPKATLTAGFSTAGTLGVGFTIMLQMADRVLLSTQPGSTRIVLELQVAEAIARSQRAAAATA